MAFAKELRLHMLFFPLCFFSVFLLILSTSKKLSLVLCPCASPFHAGTDCQGTFCLCEILQRTEGELLSIFSDELEKQGQKNENFPL